MIVVLYPDDLRYDYEGNKKKPTLNDFPALDSSILGLSDVVLYQYNNEQIILRGPIDENNAVLKVSKRTSGNRPRKLTVRHEESKLLHQGSGSCGSPVLLGTLAGNPVD